MKLYAFFLTVLLTGCATSIPSAQHPTLNPPLNAEEIKIITTCESEIGKVIYGHIEKAPIYSAYERTSLMDKCLESQGITDERISEIFKILESTY
jgi:hypothetical protein